MEESFVLGSLIVRGTVTRGGREESCIRVECSLCPIKAPRLKYLGNWEFQQWNITYTAVAKPPQYHQILANICNRHSLIVGGNTKWYSHLEDSKTISYKMKNPFTMWSSNYTLWYLPNVFQSYVYVKNCTWMFIAALVMIVKTWKQPKIYSVSELDR